MAVVQALQRPRHLRAKAQQRTRMRGHGATQNHSIILEILAERVGFAPLPVVENKELNRFLDRHDPLKRSKALVETRIEHASQLHREMASCVIATAPSSAIEMVQRSRVSCAISWSLRPIDAFQEARRALSGANDLFVAAHARALEITLVTSNTDEFARVSHLKVES